MAQPDPFLTDMDWRDQHANDANPPEEEELTLAEELKTETEWAEYAEEYLNG